MRRVIRICIRIRDDDDYTGFFMIEYNGTLPLVQRSQNVHCCRVCRSPVWLSRDRKDLPGKKEAQSGVLTKAPVEDLLL